MFRPGCLFNSAATDVSCELRLETSVSSECSSWLLAAASRAMRKLLLALFFRETTPAAAADDDDNFELRSCPIARSASSNRWETLPRPEINDLRLSCEKEKKKRKRKSFATQNNHCQCLNRPGRYALCCDSRHYSIVFTASNPTHAYRRNPEATAIAFVVLSDAWSSLFRAAATAPTPLPRPFVVPPSAAAASSCICTFCLRIFAKCSRDVVKVAWMSVRNSSRADKFRSSMSC